MAAKPPLSQQSCERLLKAMMVFSRTVDHVLENRAVATAEGPPSRAKVQVLSLLGQRGMHTTTQMASFLGVSKPAVTQMIDAMVQSGLVLRRESPHDRRGVELTLSAKGRQMFQKVRAEQRHLIRNTVRPLRDRDVDEWVRILERMTVALAQADHTFQHFCLQCGAYAEGTCVLVGGETDCPFLKRRGRTEVRRGTRSPRTRAAHRASVSVVRVPAHKHRRYSSDQPSADGAR
jgi:DNA-binding MarR family transcriptional regulator